MQKSESSRVKSDFELRASNIAAVLESGIFRAHGMLRSLAAFHAARCEIEDRGFARFTEEFKKFTSCSFSCHNEIQMLGWVPLVNDADRAEFEKVAQINGFPDFQIKDREPSGHYYVSPRHDRYFPVYNIEPFENNEEMFGYNLGSSPEISDAIQGAIDTGKITSSGRIKLTNDNFDKYGFMSFLPIYFEEIPINSTNDRRAAINGLMVGFFRIEEIFSRSFRKLDLRYFDIHIFDVTKNNEQKLLYQSREGSAHPQKESDVKIKAGFHTVREINAGERYWHVVMHSSPEYLIRQRSWKAQTFFITGLLFTLIIASYLFITLGKASYIEWLVSKRTNELESTNKMLEDEISEHNLTEEALRKSEENFRNIYNNAEVGLFRMEIDKGTIVNANARFLEMFGHDVQKKDIAGFSLFNNCADQEQYKEAIEKLKEKGEIKNTDFRFTQSGGRTVYIRLWMRIFPGAGFVEGVATDITDEKRIEEDNKKLQSQLAQSQKLESIGRLAGGVAHDFNNMLTGIIGYSELALNDVNEDSPVYKKIMVIESTGRKAAALTRQLLAFSRKQILDIRVINLNNIVENMSKLLSRVISEDVSLKINTKIKVRNIKADPSQIEQILMNLVVNSNDAMPEGGYIFIETANVKLDEEYAKKHKELKPGYYVLLSVTDTGVGMSSDIQSKIFEPFFTTKEKGKGTGLGMSTVFGIVKQHNGYILIESTLGSGTTVKVFLPAVEENIEEQAGDAEKPLLEGRETILVIDDEPFILTFIEDALKPLGYNVLTAVNSDEAYRICHTSKEKIDLLLSDVIIKGINARELSEIIRRKVPGIKVIFMSGHTEDVIVSHGILDPGVNFIYKPLTPQVLSTKIREVLDDKEDA